MAHTQQGKPHRFQGAGDELTKLAHRPQAKGTRLSRTCIMTVFFLSYFTLTIITCTEMSRPGISATTYIFDKSQLVYLEALIKPFEEQHQKWDPKFLGKSTKLSKWIQQTAEETMGLPLFEHLPRNEPKFGLKEWIGVSHQTISIYTVYIIISTRPSGVAFTTTAGK